VKLQFFYNGVDFTKVYSKIGIKSNDTWENVLMKEAGLF